MKTPSNTHIEPKRVAKTVKPPKNSAAPILIALLFAVLLLLAAALVAEVAVPEVDGVAEVDALALAMIPPSTFAGVELTELAAAER